MAAKEVLDRLPFDGTIYTEMTGFTGGLWLLWNADKVEVEVLAKTKPEIYVEVKVRVYNLFWNFSAIYTSPRSEEMCILWNNLTKLQNCIISCGLWQEILMNLWLKSDRPRMY